MKRREFIASVAAGMAAGVMPAVAGEPEVSEIVRRRWQQTVSDVVGYLSKRNLSERSLCSLDDQVRSAKRLVIFRMVVLDAKADDGVKAYDRLRESIRVTAYRSRGAVVFDFVSDAGYAGAEIVGISQLTTRQDCEN